MAEDAIFPVHLGNSKGEKHRIIEARLPSSTYVDYSMFPVYQPSGIQVPINVISTSLPEAPHNVFIQATTAQFFEDCSWR